MHAGEITDTTVSYIVLACSAAFEGASWLVALREFRKAKGGLGYYEAVRRSKDPPTFIVLFEDSAALIGLLIAFVGIFAAERLNIPELDGIASIGIGVLLGLTALLLARESKGLLDRRAGSKEFARVHSRHRTKYAGYRTRADRLHGASRSRTGSGRALA